MAPGRMIGLSIVAILLAALPLSDLRAQTATHKPAKRPSAPETDPIAAAQAQIARLRQTASQLRLLADQPAPANLPSEARVELARHEEWLRQAEQRISLLADQWEERVLPLAGADAHGKAADLNTFFETQSAVLQSKLRRESEEHGPASARVRSSRDTAQIVIDKMH